MVDKYALTLKNVLTILITASTMPLVQIILVALHVHVIVDTVVLVIKHVLTLTNVQAALIMTAMLIPIALTMTVVTLVHAKMDSRVMDSIVLISMNA